MKYAIQRIAIGFGLILAGIVAIALFPLWAPFYVAWIIAGDFERFIKEED